MLLPVIVVGCGGHSHVVIEALRLQGRAVVGVIDPALPVGTPGPFGLRVLGGDEALDKFRPNEIRLVNAIGSTNSMTVRHTIYQQSLKKGFRFAGVIHPSAVLSVTARVAEDAQIMAGCIVQSGADIGANTIVNTRASVDHDCTIGETVHIAPGVTLSGNVRVGDRTHIGTGAVVIQGITIGADSLIAAGAVVYRNVPEAGRLIPRH